MNTLILLIKILNIITVVILSYKLFYKRKINYLNSVFCSLIIFLSLTLSVFLNNLTFNIIIFLLLMITFIVISNMPDKVELENSSILIRDGKINILEIIKNGYSLMDVMKKIKSLNTKKVSDIDLAILDRDGKLSFYRNNDNLYRNISLLIIVFGNINYDSLKIINKDSSWLINELNKKKLLLSDVICAFFNNNLLYIIKK